MKIPRRHFLTACASWLALPSAAVAFVVGDDVSSRKTSECETSPDFLSSWKRSPRHPVFETSDPTLARLIEATQAGRDLVFRYFGGTTPGEVRHVSPGLVFRIQDFPATYLSGFCHTRQAERVFRVDRMELGGVAG
jgi:predicted DNA-binding transcriptional regulator YafY